MRAFIKRHVVAAAAAAMVLAGGAGVAIAQSGGGAGDPGAGAGGAPTPASSQEPVGASPANPQSGERGVGVPKGPFIDFCPSTEQIEAHLKRYGLDYKPVGVACNREGEVASLNKPAADPKPDRSEEEACKAEKELFRNAREVPGGAASPDTIHAVLPNGREVIVSVLGNRDGSFTLDEVPGMLPC